MSIACSSHDDHHEHPRRLLTSSLAGVPSTPSQVASPLDHLLQLLSGLGGLIPGVVTGFAIAFAWWVRDGHGAAGHGQIMPQASMAPGMDQQPSWKEAPAEKGPTDTKWAEHTPPGTGKPQPQPAIGQPVLMDA